MPITDTALSRISLRDVLYVIFSKIKILIGILVAIVGVTMGFAFAVDPVYETSATILLKPSVDSTVLAQVAPGSLRASPVSQQDINSEIEIMSSPDLLKLVVVELGLDKSKPKTAFISRLMAKVKQGIKGVLVALGLSLEVDPTDRAVDNLRDKLDIEPVTLSNMIRVANQGTDPEEIAKTVNTLVDAYIDRHIAVHQAKGSLEFFNKQAGLYAAKLKEAEKALQAFQSKWSITDLKAQKAAGVELVKELTRRLMEVKSKIAEEKSRLEAIRKSVSETGQVEAMTGQLRQSNAVIELTKSLIPLMVERERIALLYPKDSVEYQDADRQVEEVRKAIEVETKKVLGGSQVDLDALATHAEALGEEIKTIDAEANFLAARETELERLRRDVRQAEKNYLLYADKTEEARISEQEAAARVANVSVASWADIPSAPIFPKKILLGLASLVVGLVAGVAGAFLSHYLDHTVKTPGELARHAQVPVLTTLGEIEPPAAADGKQRV